MKQKLSLRLRLACLLIGGSPLIANVRVQKVEAVTHDGTACSFHGVTLGEVRGNRGIVAIGQAALSGHNCGEDGHDEPGVPLADVRQDHPDLQWLFDPKFAHQVGV